MKVLIIGSSGLVGGNVHNYFSEVTDWNLVGTYNKFEVAPFIQFDASAIDGWSDNIKNVKWDVIIHTGALTHVDKCEDEPELSKLLTVQSTANLCSLAKKHNSKLVYISTDYVFNGENGPYREDDQTDPLCVYGHHKLDSENIIKSNLSDYLILRVTNVYGDEVRGKNFLSRTISQLKNDGNVSITAPSDQYATPVNALDIAKAMFLLIRDCKNGVYHIASTDYLNRVQFLKRINSYFDNKLIIKPVITHQLNQSAKRPLMGGLLSEKFMGLYPDFMFSNIDDYLKKYK